MKPIDTLTELIAGLPSYGTRTLLLQLEKEDTRQYRYDELCRTCRKLASGLIQSGIQPGDRVGLFANPGFEWMAACLGTLQAGALVTPLDLQLTQETLSAILLDSGAKAVFSTSDHIKRLHQSVPEHVAVYTIDTHKPDSTSWDQLLSADEHPLPDIKAQDGAALFYTSGTTGPPKGVPLSHANLAFQINTIQKTGLVKKNDRFLLPLPLHHVYPFVIGIWLPLSLGLTLVLPYSLTGPQLVRAMRESGTTVIIGVPRLYDALFSGIANRFQFSRLTQAIFELMLKTSLRIRRATGKSAGKWLFRPLHRRFAPNLRMTASGGAALDPELGFKLEALGWNVAIGYGLTETAPLLTIKEPADLNLSSVGRPIEGVRLRIDPAVLPDTGEPERTGQSADRPAHNKQTAGPQQGEIQAQGPNVFAGYYNLPEKTAEAFTSDGWFRTGDLGHLDQDNYLYITGRVSTLIVTPGGENIQPDVIEKKLASDPVIGEAGVLQKKDGSLAAILVPDARQLRKTGQENIEQVIQQALARRSAELPSYQRIGDYAVTRTALPRTRLGKIRRHLLANIFQEAKEQKAGTQKIKAEPMALNRMSAQDRDLLENPAVENVWNLLAGRYPDKGLTPDSSPELDLGIDSMEWLNITMEIRERAGIELDEGTIAEIASIRDLLEAVAEQSAGGRTLSLESPLKEPHKALSPLQKRWLAPLQPGQIGLAYQLFRADKSLVERVFKLRVFGIEHVPPHGPFVITPNHVSYLDPFALAAALGFDRLRQIYWAGFTGAAFKNAFFRYFSRLAQVVPIDPQRGIVSSMAFGAAVLKSGRGLVWFPEGERSPTGRLQPFRTGVGLLLEHYPVPAVPVYIRGTEKILPPGQALPRPGSISLVFGRPVNIGDLAQKGRAEEKRRHIAEALHDRVMALSKDTAVSVRYGKPGV